MLVRLLTLLIALSLSSAREGTEPGRTSADHSMQVVCYWGTWANYRPNAGKFTPEEVDPTLCTNLIYSFAGLNGETWKIKSLDPWMDLADEYGLDGFGKAASLKYVNPKLKVTLAIGGWNEGSKKYSEMARDPEKRKIFVQSVIDFLEKYNLDGLDLDWEYPAKRGGIADDKRNFIKLIRDLRSAFDSRGTGLVLTAAIGAAASTIDVSYDIPSMYKYLDFVHVMCYDYHGKWDKKTGHNAPLSARPGERGSDLYLNVNHTWNYLMKKGAVPEKTVLGVPFYGRAFLLKNPHDARMGAKSKTTSFQGPYTREDGFLGYNEICEEQYKHRNSVDEEEEEEEDWVVEWENHYQAPYMHKGLKWVSYDDPESIAIKSRFAADRGAAGVMMWSIDTDDFRGNCGLPQGRFPLLKTINRVLYEYENGIGAAGRTTLASSLATVVVAVAVARMVL